MDFAVSGPLRSKHLQHGQFRVRGPERFLHRDTAFPVDISTVPMTISKVPMNVKRQRCAARPGDFRGQTISGELHLVLTALGL